MGIDKKTAWAEAHPTIASCLYVFIRGKKMIKKTHLNPIWPQKGLINYKKMLNILKNRCESRVNPCQKVKTKPILSLCVPRIAYCVMWDKAIFSFGVHSTPCRIYKYGIVQTKPIYSC